MKNVLFILGFALLIACSSAKEDSPAEEKTDTVATQEVKQESADPKLVKQWETDTVLKTCESVLYDAEGGRLFVSNIDGKPLDKNGKGYISILNLDGTVQELKWATGLNAPKGMGIYDGNLYVTDIDRIVAIDLESGEMAKEMMPDEAEFLNDITVGENAVYVSDMNLGLIHKIENGELSTIAEGVKSVNGLLAKDNSLYLLDAKGLRKMNLADASFEMINNTVTGGDGLTMLSEDEYVASRWQGEIYYVAGQKAIKLLDTKENEVQSADIGLNRAEKIVYVPTFFSNKVVAYKLEM